MKPQQQSRAQPARRVVCLNAVSSTGQPILWAVDSQNRRVAEIVTDPDLYDSAVQQLWQILDDLDPVATTPHLRVVP